MTSKSPITKLKKQGNHMRRKESSQMPLQMRVSNHPRAKEFQVISMILDKHSNLFELVAKDLSRGRNPNDGRNGMTGEQARCARRFFTSAHEYPIGSWPFIFWSARLIATSSGCLLSVTFPSPLWRKTSRRSGPKPGRRLPRM